MSNSSIYRAGVISDTHGLMRPEVLQKFAGVDHILHAGDIGKAEILEQLRGIAPVTAIKGNIDTSGYCAGLPAAAAVELQGNLFYVVHALADLDIVPSAAGVDAIIYGHSHRVSVEKSDGVLYLNPGSAGPRRFDLPVTVAFIEIVRGELKPSIIDVFIR